MIMDPSFTDFPDYTNGYQTNQFTISDQYSSDFGLTIDDYLLSSSTVALTSGEESPSSIPLTTPSQDDTEFAETVKYISQILMEENMEEKPTMFYDPLGLQLTEKSFYDALNPLTVETPDSSSSSTSFDSTNSGTTTSTPPSVDELLSLNIFRHTDSISQFNRGQEEASRFLPKPNPLSVAADGSIPKKKGNHRRESDEDSDEERSNKQSAVYKADEEEEEELSEMFDKVLLNTDHSFCQGQQCCGQAEPSPAVAPAPQPSPAPARGKKQQKQSKKETVDLRTLLLLCAQAVSASDVRTSQELLKQIRQNSSPLGDGSQRMAHFFANALEARLAGTGSTTTGTKLYYSAMLSNSSAADVLKAYQLNLSSCPFKKFSIFLANKAIARAAENASCLHIVDFGILYGFQWPILIQYLSKRLGGPPKLRITGIEYPQRGFRPKERIEETGRRLEKYCQRFGIDFEYNAIASERWETIRVEDVGIRPGEVVAVNCLIRFKNLLDETASAESGSCPRNVVLRLIRRMNPAVFVQSVVNGAYNAPFFVTRFREALFHFSALFDAWDVVVPGGNVERLMFEREFYGREVMNVVACEGVDRVERPETYRQWQVRNTRAGFRSLPLDPEIMGKFREKLKAWYHKDFVMDQDNNWMLQGWKGRIVYASSCWVPV